jgi:predicted transposase YbfD/YdcC
MSQPGRPLSDVLAAIPDPRQARGKRYPLGAVLALACAAMLCGYRSYSALAEGGRNYGAALLQAWGFPRATAPCAARLSLLFRRLDCEHLEAALGQGAEAALAAAPPAPDAGAGLSLDGKTLRGSRKQGAPGAHLLSALSQRLGLTLAQTAVDEQTNEISAVHTVLGHVLLAGRVVTLDALLTQRTVAQTIVDHGGDYVLVAKDNQPHVRQDIAGLLATPPHLAAPLRSAQTVDKGHGRIERRHLTTRALLPGACEWPGAQQVFRLERRVIRTTTGESHTAVLAGLTSRSAEAADPQQVLGFLRDYWHIENKAHWVRAVTFDEDRSQVRTGAIPQVMAALRKATIGLLRCAGATNIAAACRYYAAQPWAALTLRGIEPRTEN